MYTDEHNTYTLSAVTCCPHKPGFTRLSIEWSSCCCHILKCFLSQLSALCCSCPLILHHSNSKRDTARARWGGLAYRSHCSPSDEDQLQELFSVTRSHILCLSHSVGQSSIYCWLCQCWVDLVYWRGQKKKKNTAY